MPYRALWSSRLKCIGRLFQPGLLFVSLTYRGLRVWMIRQTRRKCCFGLSITGVVYPSTVQAFPSSKTSRTTSPIFRLVGNFVTTLWFLGMGKLWLVNTLVGEGAWSGVALQIARGKNVWFIIWKKYECELSLISSQRTKVNTSVGEGCVCVRRGRGGTVSRGVGQLIWRWSLLLSQCEIFLLFSL